jgi:hypothetical protein
MEIKVNRIVAKPILFMTNLFPCKKIMLVCKGYGEDYEFYTELCWKEDKELDFINDKTYQDFKLWF